MRCILYRKCSSNYLIVRPHRPGVVWMRSIAIYVALWRSHTGKLCGMAELIPLSRFGGGAPGQAHAGHGKG